jgi:hypothetical protein
MDESPMHEVEEEEDYFQRICLTKKPHTLPAQM